MLATPVLGARVSGHRRRAGAELSLAKKLTGAATISVGSVGLSGEFIAAFGGEGSTSTGLGQLVDRMDRDEFDLIAVGRALISDPNWVAKIRTATAPG